MAGSRDRARAALLFALGCCLVVAPRVILARSQGTSPFLKLTPTVRSMEQPRYDTAYACEGKTLKIECKPGELIHLIRANYGRFSITICNDHGNTEWSVNCMSPKSLRVLHNRCEFNRTCEINVSRETFNDDPCPGTHKYIEAHFMCMTIATTTTTTTRPSLPWLITSQPSVWSTAKQTVTVRGGGGGATSHREPQPPPPPAPQQPPVATSPPALGASTQKEAAATVSTSPPTRSSSTTTTTAMTSSIATIAGERAASDLDETPVVTTQEPSATSSSWRISSPPATGLGVEDPSIINEGESLTPHMGAGDHWNEESPQQPLQVCAPSLTRSIQWNWTRVGEVSVQPCPGGATGLARWRCNPTGQWHTRWPDLSECRSVWLTSLESRIEEGDSITSIANDLSLVTSSKTLYGGDMMTTTKIIKKMALRMASNIQTFPDPQQREAIVTELLQGVMRTGSNLLDAAQQASWLDLTYQEQMRVATSLLMGLEENAFLLADTVIREKTVVHKDKNILLSIRVLETQHVSSEQFPSDSIQEHWNVSRDRLDLPRGALLENSDGGLVRLVLVAFDRLEHILQPAVPTMHYARNTTQIINSKVISASLGKGRHIQLSEPVRLWLAHLRTENVSNPMCVFWDYTMSSWSDDGCDVAATNLTHTHCVCNHLTNFAVLMDIHSMEPPREHQLALQLITYIGCSVSVVCLVLAIITFQLFRGLKSDRTTIHKNLCVCLLIGEILFLAGIAQTDKKIVCSVVAGLLHFFFLCAFAWMFLEGFQLYVMLIEVFEAEKSRVRWYYLLAYGAPLLIVVVSSLIDPSSYGTDRYCWLSADNFFIFSFVGPVIAVIIANLVFLSMAIYMMCRHANASASMKSKEHSRLASVRAWLRGAIVLVFLLGLTWTFGLLYLNQESIIMAYIFTILNSLQGLFIFVFHCVQNEKVRKEYRKLMRRHSWLPKWLRCWKQSGSKERRSSVYAGSNGNPSAGNSHSTESCGTSHLPPRAWNCRSSGRGSLPGPSPGSLPGSSQAASGGSAVPAAEVCVATLPYARNGRANNSPPLINLPKSATTWGPLHKPLMWKNISFKSYSRDSGHGGSEQEESPRTHTTTALNNLNNVRCLNNVKDPPRRLAYASHSGSMGGVNVSTHGHGHGHVDYTQGIISNDLATEYLSGTLPAGNLSPIPQARPAKKYNTAIVPGTLGSTSGGHHGHRAASPYNHTYTEIREARGHHPGGHHGHDDDPVYEEIERTSEIQVSDMSDEDGKRQSDMSRQSSRSYGDHRPLISVSAGGSSGSCSGGAGGWDRDRYLPATSARTVAVLDGETVVCHLEPDQTHHPHTLYSTYHPSYLARTNNLPPYSEC